jgi:hypothetical protein
LDNIIGPLVLTDHSRLPEIYHLRVLAWEQSPGSDNINSQKYPDGYRDHLEERSIHSISTNHEGQIIAAARLTVCHSLDELPYPDVFKAFEHLMPTERPFMFYSRLVIHPNYRKRGLAGKFDEMKLAYQKQKSICLGVATVKPKRYEALRPYGFEALGPGLGSPNSNYDFPGSIVIINRIY